VTSTAKAVKTEPAPPTSKARALPWRARRTLRYRAVAPRTRQLTTRRPSLADADVDLERR
jgi:hypothetical protein